MSQAPTAISSGNSRLDQVLGGGLTANRIYLLDGHPGSGKTTLGLQFLMDGILLGEKGLYVTLSETKSELEAIADSHGWSLDGVCIHELVDSGASFTVDSQYTMFEPSEIELGETTRNMLAQVEKLNPKRVVLDSLSELRLLAQSALRYRRQILALKHFFVGRECTVILLDDKTTPDQDLQLHSIAHGVISLDCTTAELGKERRRLRVVKFRGRQYLGGWHDFEIQRGGIEIYPRLSGQHGGSAPPTKPLLSGNQSLDTLLGLGILPGTSTLLLGPAGVGKSSCATLFAVTACLRGERAVIFTFDESRATLIKRSEGLKMQVRMLEEQGALEIFQVNPGDISPGRFTDMVRQAVERETNDQRTSVVVIDSLNGYMSAMPEESHLQIQMHELLFYLGSCGIATFLVVAQHGMLGSAMLTPIDTSYLADTVILFRYFEANGEIRQAISVVKKRDGHHERTIREFCMVDGQIVVGKPLSEFRGILTGTPIYVGDKDALLLKKENDDRR